MREEDREREARDIKRERERETHCVCVFDGERWNVGLSPARTSARKDLEGKNVCPLAPTLFTAKEKKSMNKNLFS